MTESKPPHDLTNARVDLNHPDQAQPEGQSPKQPNDRDENVGSTAAAPDATVAQGKRDVDRGLQDTSKAEATDATYAKQKQQ